MRRLLLLVAATLLNTLSGQVLANVVGGVDFPKSLSGFELRSVIDNEKANPGLGYTLLYNAPGVKVSVFVYDDSQRGLPEGVDAPVVRKEFAKARGNVQQVYPDAQILVREERFVVGGVPLLHSAFQYSEMKPGVRETMLSHLYLTSRKGNFVKVRATYSANDELGHHIHVQFIEELCRVITK